MYLNTSFSLFCRRPYKPKRLKGRHVAKFPTHSSSKSSSSTTSDEDSPDSFSPIPRVRSIEALEFLSKAKQQRMAALMIMQQQNEGGKDVAKAMHIQQKLQQQQQQTQNSNPFMHASAPRCSSTSCNEWQNTGTTSVNTQNNSSMQSCCPAIQRQVDMLPIAIYVDKFLKCILNIK